MSQHFCLLTLFRPNSQSLRTAGLFFVLQRGEFVSKDFIKSETTWLNMQVLKLGAIHPNSLTFQS